jgi:hypothetical protein
MRKLRQITSLYTGVLALVLLSACTQEPLFYYISQEYPPVEPIITGAPSQLVGLGNRVYLSNNDIWYCDLSSSTSYEWKKLENQPEKDVKMVAAITSPSMFLYALGWEGDIWECDVSAAPLSSWTHITQIDNAQQLYGAEDALFVGTFYGEIGAFNGVSGSAVYYIDKTVTPPYYKIGEDKGLLQGAVKSGSNYYLGILSGGIFNIGNALPPAAPLGTATAAAGAQIKGMIGLANDIAAVNANGTLYYSASTGFNKTIEGPGFSGALALWKDTVGNNILLVGLERGTNTSTYAYGYRELNLDGSGNIIAGDTTPHVPGSNTGAATTILPDSSTTAAIGKYPVTSLFAAPASAGDDGHGRPKIFASTLQNGLWSYRVRNNGTPQWNGENNQ